jgi:DNA replication licensing factor MCM2
MGYKLDQSSQAVYPSRITKMCTDNKQSLEVSFTHISIAEPTLSIWVADHPELIIELFDEEATNLVLSAYPDYARIHSRIKVRIGELPIIDKIRNLRFATACRHRHRL